MNWTQEALNNEVEKFRSRCLAHIADLENFKNMNYVSNEDMKMFTDAFINTLEYPNLEIYEGDTDRTQISIYGGYGAKDMKDLIHKFRITLLANPNRRFRLLGIWRTKYNEIEISWYK